MCFGLIYGNTGLHSVILLPRWHLSRARPKLFCNAHPAGMATVAIGQLANGQTMAIVSLLRVHRKQVW